MILVHSLVNNLFRSVAVFFLLTFFYLRVFSFPYISDIVSVLNCSRCSDANLVEIPVEVETPDRHYYHVCTVLACYVFHIVLLIL